MAVIEYKTKGGAEATGRRRVYFSGHPDDGIGHLDRICQLLWKSHDCAVYYTPDMAEAYGEGQLEDDPGRCQLFVFPVTLRLLTEDCRAISTDLAYALEKHIPILPFMMEEGLDGLYSDPKLFGELQYLKPDSKDLTEISFEEKLRHRLDQLLIDDGLADLIREEFDGYIFLSYRKMDRRYAGELMKLIHRDERYRDIAIWYDEFLTPGESFRQNIDRMLSKSDLFALLVTPNLPADTPEGRPNFVVAEEYPRAKGSGMAILPAEMVKTDRELLTAKFKGLGDCVDPYSESEFYTRLEAELKLLSDPSNDSDPRHIYLIGLAYLEGIDVEVDRERGLALLDRAADLGYKDAIQKLYDMYSEGKYLPLDYRRAMDYVGRLYSSCKEEFGERDQKTLYAQSEYIRACLNVADRESISLAETMAAENYRLQLEELGEGDSRTVEALLTCASVLSSLSKPREQYTAAALAYQMAKKYLDERHQVRISAINFFAVSASKMDKYKEAEDAAEEYYRLCKMVYGEESLTTLIALHNLHSAMSDYTDRETRIREGRELYDRICRLLGADHPHSISFQLTLSSIYAKLEMEMESVGTANDAYNRASRVLGERHPMTLSAKESEARIWYRFGLIESALGMFSEVYAGMSAVYGERHQNTLHARFNIANCYRNTDRAREGLAIDEDIYKILVEELGENHSKSLQFAVSLAQSYMAVDRPSEAEELLVKTYHNMEALYGREHTDMIDLLLCLSEAEDALGQGEEAMRLSRGAYDMCLRLYDDKHSVTTVALEKAILYHKKYSGEEQETVRDIEDINSYFRSLDAEEQARVTPGQIVSTIYGIDWEELSKRPPEEILDALREQAKEGETNELNEQLLERYIKDGNTESIEYINLLVTLSSHYALTCQEEKLFRVLDLLTELYSSNYDSPGIVISMLDTMISACEIIEEKSKNPAFLRRKLHEYNRKKFELALNDPETDEAEFVSWIYSVLEDYVNREEYAPAVFYARMMYNYYSGKEDVDPQTLSDAEETLTLLIDLAGEEE